MSIDISEGLPAKKKAAPVVDAKKGGDSPKGKGGGTTEENSAKRIRQAVYDIRYRARREDIDLKAAYAQYMSNTSMDQKEKAAVRDKLFGKKGGVSEQYFGISDDWAIESMSRALNSVFIEGAQKEEVIELEYVNKLAEESERKYKVRVLDPKSKKSYVRYATREKISQLRQRGLKVEMTEHGDPYEGTKKAKKDYDGDGKKESSSKEHAGVVHNAIQRKKGGDPDGQDTRKEEYLADGTTSTEPTGQKINPKNVNNYATGAVKIAPKQEADKQAGYSTHGESVEFSEDSKYGYDSKGRSLNPKDKAKRDTRSNYAHVNFLKNKMRAGLGVKNMLPCIDPEEAEQKFEKVATSSKVKAEDDIDEGVRQAVKALAPLVTGGVVGATLAHKQNKDRGYDTNVPGTRAVDAVKKWWNKPIIAPTITKPEWDKRVKDGTTHELIEPKKQKKIKEGKIIGLESVYYSEDGETIFEKRVPILEKTKEEEDKSGVPDGIGTPLPAGPFKKKLQTLPYKPGETPSKLIPLPGKTSKKPSKGVPDGIGTPLPGKISKKGPSASPSGTKPPAGAVSGSGTKDDPWITPAVKGKNAPSPHKSSSGTPNPDTMIDASGKEVSNYKKGSLERAVQDKGGKNLLSITPQGTVLNRQVGGYAKAKDDSKSKTQDALNRNPGNSPAGQDALNRNPGKSSELIPAKLTPAKLTPARLIKREFQNRVSGESYIPEEGYDRMRDRRLELYGTGHDGSDRKGSSGGSRKPQTKKERKESQKRSEQAYKNVVQSLKDKYGDNAVITSSRKKKAKKDK